MFAAAAILVALALAITRAIKGPTVFDLKLFRRGDLAYEVDEEPLA